MEKFTPTDQVLYRNLGFTCPEAVQLIEGLDQVFPPNFAEAELTASMRSMGEILFQALQGEPPTEARSSLIRFGVMAGPAFAEKTVFDYAEIESRISLSLVEAQRRIQEGQGLPPLRRVERDHMHREYRDAIQANGYHDL